LDEELLFCLVAVEVGCVVDDEKTKKNVKRELAVFYTKEKASLH